MEIVCGITHLIMALCLITILYWSGKSEEAIYDQGKLLVTKRFYTRSLKLAEVVAFAVCRVAGNILIAYLK